MKAKIEITMLLSALLSLTVPFVRLPSSMRRGIVAEKGKLPVAG